MSILLVAVLASQSAAPPPAVFNSAIEEIVVANGMRAVVARTPPVPGRAPRVFVGLYLRYGTATAGRPELAHLVEHIGANNAPALVNYRIPTSLQQFGGNAMTRPDYLSFWRTVAPEGLEAMIPNRANRVLGVGHDSTVFTTQVGRVAAETERRIARIAARGLTPTDLLPGVMFGNGVPLAALLDSIRSFPPAEKDSARPRVALVGDRA